MRSYRFIDWATQGFLAVVTLVILLNHNMAPGYWPLLVLAHLTAMALVHGLVRACEKDSAPKAIQFLRDFYPILFYTAFFRETELINAIIGTARLDPYLMRLEHRLFGIQPSVSFMNAAPHLWLSELLYASYFSYYLMVAGLGFWLLCRNPPVFRHFVAVVSFVFYVCYLTYMFVPVVGPRLLFWDTPERALYGDLYGTLPPAVPEMVQVGPFFQCMAFIYRNFQARSAAFPSSHVAVALTTLWFSWRYLRPIRWIHTVAVILLCLATVYCRYHYAIDVPSGVVTAVILVPLGNWLYRRFDRPEEIEEAARDVPYHQQPPLHQ